MYAIINSASNNITTSFGSGAGSLLVNGAPSTGTVSFYNSCTGFVAITIIGTQTTEVPSSDPTVSNQYLLWPAPSGGAATLTADKFPINKGDKVYVRSVSGTLSSGSVAITAW